MLPKINFLLQNDSILDTLLQQIQELTIIRDVYGKIHFYVEYEHASSLTTDQKIQFHAIFSRELGNYYTKDLWESNQKKVQDAGLIDAIKRERVTYDLGVSYPIFLLERHQAKHIWTLQNTATPPWDTERILQEQKPAIVSFFSFKGGAGRTTSLIGTALSLAKAGKKVVIIDLDLEAPGLSSIFFKEHEIYTGVVDYLIEKQIHENRWNIYQHILSADPSILGDFSDNLKIVPAGIVDANFIQKLARLDFQHLTTNQVGVRLHKLLDEIARANRDLDFILLDARAGFHDIGGFALSDLSHAAVIVGQHTKQTWAGLSYVIERLAKPYNNISERLPLLLVHSMAPIDNVADYEIQQQFREKAYDVFTEKYYSADEAVPNSNNTEEPFYPFVIPWTPTLRGDISFTIAADSPSGYEQERNRRLSTQLTDEHYYKLAEKLCNIFEKTLERE